jgi:DNA repair exonuclease SbcCD ATPase subunit
MQLKSLHIRALPGLEPGFDIDFDPRAVNVVTGPNASGKSSLVRAVRAILYPQSLAGYAELRAEWQRGEETLVGERRGHHVSWMADGRSVEAPALPPLDAAGAFLIHAEDLNALGDTDQHIAAHLRTLLAGGYDLDGVMAQKALTAPPRPKKLAGELNRLDQAVAGKEAEYVELDEELATLSRLRGQLEETADAAGQLRAIEDALALADAIAERDALERTQETEFPSGMERLRGDEIERLKQADEKLDQRRRELNSARNAIESARKQLGENGNVDPQTLEALQAELAEDRDRLADLEQRIDQTRDEIKSLEAAAKQAARRLGKTDGVAANDKLDQSALEELERRVDRVQSMREQIRSLTGELTRAHVSSNISGRSQSDLRDARQALQQWLDGARTSALEGVLWGGLSLAAAAAAWRLLGPQALEPLPELIMLILIAAGVPLGLLAHFILRWRDQGQAVQAFLATDIEAPLGWTQDEVEARLERLDRDLESATRHEISQARAAEVRDQLNSQRSTFDQARQQLNSLAQEIGLDADPRLETSFLLWCRHLHEWQTRESALEGARQRLVSLEARYAGFERDVAERLARHGFDEGATRSHEGGRRLAEGSRTLATIVHQLTPRMRRNSELHNEVASLRHRIGELSTDIEQLRAAREPIFVQAGLKSGDREGLALRADQLEAWRQLEQSRRDQATEINRLETRLAEDGELIRLAREQARETLERRHAELSERVAERDQLNQRVGEIQTRHEDLLERRELQALSSERAGVRHQLQSVLEESLLSEAASLLIDDVRQAHEVSNEPAALTQAARWFERFTRHRYRLHFHNDHFSALDTKDGRERAVSELSTGTRVQLLLAVRLAWIERLEDQAEPLPVFMDEVLTTTDPDRYQAVVASVQELVSQGRQMFYLTAQRDDAQAWSEWAGDGPTPHLIDMAQVRAGQIEPLEHTMPIATRADKALPDPSAMSAEDWADAVGVDAISPWRDAGSMHVFHILRDELEQVAELVRYDLARLGELESFLASNQASELISQKVADRMHKRIRAARAIIEDWRQGHDRPVDTRALVESGAVSENFLERVIALSEESKGDPQALIEGLKDGKVSRFRSDNIKQLDSWLVEHGYCNCREGASAAGSAAISLAIDLPPEEVTRLREWIEHAIADPLSASP